MKKNQRLYDVLSKYGCDTAVLSLPENVLHASGMVNLPNTYAVGFFNWSLPLATVIINVKEQKEVLYIPDSVLQNAKKYSFFENIITYCPYKLEKMLNPAEEYVKGFKEVFKEYGCEGKTAVEPSLPHIIREAIGSVYPKTAFTDASKELFESKMVKAPWEIERMKKAAVICDSAFLKLNELSHDGAGKSELALWREIFGAMVDTAGKNVHISGELVTGERSFNSSYPGGPTDRIVNLGDVGIMDMSVRYMGYWCDCCNVVSFGKRNDVQLRLFNTIYNAYEYMKRALKPGAAASEVYAASEKAYTENGYECPHYIGHAIGTGLNDMPKIIPCDDTVIEEGMTFSMEPGIYKENMGLRIEKMLLVTKDGCEEFNKFNWGVYEW